MAFTINPPNSPLVNARGVVDPVWYRFFANIQRVLGDDAVAEIQQAPILTWQPTTALSNERVLIPGYGIDLSLSAPALTVSLEPSGVVAGPYGSSTETLQIEVDGAGRVVAAQSIPLSSDNVAEGGSNLYFTDARARGALSQGVGIAYDPATGGISLSGVAFGNIRTVTSNAAVNASDQTLLANATGGAIVIGLPAAASSVGRLICVKKIDASANTVTIDGSGAETIDGAATYSISAQWMSLTVQCDGVAWFVV